MKKFFITLFLIFIAFQSALAGTDKQSYMNNEHLIDDYIDMARLYTTSAQYDKALEYIDIIEKMSPNNPKVMYEKAIILKNYNQPILARNLMREVAQMAPEYKESYLYKEFFKDDIPGFYTPKSYDVDYYTKKGFEAYRENKIEKSIEYFRNALVQKKNVETMNNIGMAYMKSSTPKEALKYFQDVLEIDARYYDTYINLAIYYCDVVKDEKKQISYLKKAIKINPKKDTPYYMMGNIYLDKGMYETAVEYYKLAISKNDLNADAYYAMGYSWFQLQKYEDAYFTLKKSLEIELDSVKVYEYLTKSAMQLKKYDEAENYANYMLNLEPTPERYIELVRILYLKQDYEKCLEILDNKIDSEKNAEMFNYIGLCNFQLNKYEKAIAYFIMAINVEEKPSYFYNLAICYNVLHDHENMTKYLEMAVNTPPKTVLDYVDIVKVYVDLGQLDNMLSTLNRAIIEYPNERQFYNLKLETLQRLGKTVEYNAFNLQMKDKFKKEPVYTGK